MNSPVFGEMNFDMGWKTQTEISLFDNNYNVIVKVKAYFEQDGISESQQKAILDFDANKNKWLEIAENLLTDFTESDASSRFMPSVLLFQRDGSYALLLDDQQYDEDGIVACFQPEAKIVFQYEYL